MKTEIEVKFLNVDIEEIRAKLSAAGAELEQPMRLMKRAIIEPEVFAGRDAFLRLRDEGDKTTLTFKEFQDRSNHDVQEIEVVVSDFQAMLGMFDQMQMHYRSFQESKRETWKYNDVEIVIDEWPWLEPYIEIEGDSEAAIQAVAAELGFSWDDAVFGHVDVAYKQKYPNMTNRGVIDLAEVRFGEPVPKEFLGES